MKKPKILFISYAFYPQMGGIEVNAEILSSNFHRFGYQIRLVTIIKEKGNKTFPFPVIRDPGILELYKLHKWADVVFENNPSIRLSWPSIFFKSKSVIAMRGRVSRNDGTMVLQDKLKHRKIKNADAVIAVSSAVRDKFFPSADVIGNPYREDLFKDLNFNRLPLSFAFLGRLVSEKGVHIAIESIKQLTDLVANDFPKPTLKIIGDGPELEIFKELVQKYHLENQVIFLGRKHGLELVEVLNTCKYILIPSLWEAFGNVALEGMACGCLPIASDSRGLPEAVGNAGVLFKTYSSEALTNAIFELIHNPKLEAEYRSNMKAHLEQHLPERVAQKYLDVIENAYQKK